MCLLSLNEKDKAKDLLIKNIKTDIDAYIETYPSASKKKVATYIEKLYKPYLEALDMKIDLSIFDEPKQ
jgi:N-formylglutamate amidohydrolase